MLRNLTKVADCRGLTIIACPRLKGKKYGIMFEGGREVLVSPTVYDLLKTDWDAVVRSLKVQVLPPEEKVRWGGESNECRVLPEL